MYTLHVRMRSVRWVYICTLDVTRWKHTLKCHPKHPFDTKQTRMQAHAHTHTLHYMSACNTSFEKYSNASTRSYSTIFCLILSLVCDRAPFAHTKTRTNPPTPHPCWFLQPKVLESNTESAETTLTLTYTNTHIYTHVRTLALHWGEENGVSEWGDGHLRKSNPPSSTSPSPSLCTPLAYTHTHTIFRTSNYSPRSRTPRSPTEWVARDIHIRNLDIYTRTDRQTRNACTINDVVSVLVRRIFEMAWEKMARALA